MNTREAMAGIGLPERPRWPFEDRWGGASITQGSACAQSRYAMQMYAAAERGELDQFMRENQGVKK